MAIRDAWHSIRSSPATILFAVLVLTGASAAGTVAFSVVDAVVWRSLPYTDSDRIVVVGPDRPSLRNSWPEEYLAWRSSAGAFAAIAATSVGPVAELPFGAGVAKVRAWHASASLFDVLGVRPFLGRVFSRSHETDGQHLVAVISHHAWQRYFASDPGVIGRFIRLRTSDEDPGMAVEIIGVMPRAFTYPLDVSPSVWIPLIVRSTSPSVQVVARLRDRRTLSEAQAQIETLSDAVYAQAGQQRRDDRRPVLLSFNETFVRDDVKRWMFLVLCGVGLVMLVAWLNVAGLMLVRSIRRSQDLRVRAAVGASPGQLAAGLIAEGVVVSLAAAVFGSLLALWGIDVTKAALPGGIPRAEDIRLDLRVLALTLSASAVAGVGFSALPAWYAAKARSGMLLSRGVSTATLGRGGWRAALVIAQVAVISALLVVSTVFVWNFVRVVRADLGFSRAEVVLIELQEYGGPTRPVFDAIAATPGVLSVAELAGSPPLVMAAYGGSETRLNVRAASSAADSIAVSATTYRVSPTYFNTAGIPLLRGRTFTDAEARSPVAIVDQLTAQVLFGENRDPIGSRVVLHPKEPPRTIVGVVGTVHTSGPEEVSGTQLYLPKAPDSQGTPQLIVKTSRPARRHVAAIAAALKSVLPAELLPPAIRTWEEAFQRLTAGRRANAGVMGALAIVILLIGTTGIYAMMSAVVAQQRREFGVKLALGATQLRIACDVLVRAGGEVAAGLVAGLLAGRALAEVFESLLVDVPSADAMIYGTVAVMLLTAAFAAASVPAARAAFTDPIRVLRSE